MNVRRFGQNGLDPHPIAALDQPEAGYLLDLLREFQDAFPSGMEPETWSALACLAARHVPLLQARFGFQAGGASPAFDALAGRLRLAGHVEHRTGQGLVLSRRGAGRLDGLFRPLVRSGDWMDVLDAVRDELIWYAETESLPLTASC